MVLQKIKQLDYRKKYLSEGIKKVLFIIKES